ncbi:hypothetical protein V1290_001626 [Bradyrhizobium sp. AZCC 1578]|uniref:hypothetical protein n=1 Tax=Bradyrhizobium sp. AZCC 1578 TaxID=3117027 RepID=UPI002FEEF0DD
MSKSAQVTVVAVVSIAWLLSWTSWAFVHSRQAIVRLHMRPSPRLLPVCGVDDHTEIDADLANMMVSGVALVGETKRTSTVKLQHHPPSVSETGLIVLAIDHGQVD